MYYDIVESGKRIKKLRKASGMTQQELADKVGISLNMIGYIERGVKGVSTDTLGTIATIFLSSVDYIAFGSNIVRLDGLTPEKAEMVMKFAQNLREL